MRRLKQGDSDAFDFLAEEGIETKVLGPMVTRVGGKDGLLFLGDPPSGPRTKDVPRFAGFSASHTVNGHSVILRMTYGHFRFLFTGDLNRQAELDLIKHHARELKAEVFKVPHHGSADFSTEFTKAVQPLCSIASSGDESSAKEYIHPRANLMGALGRFSRSDEPLIFVTKLAAFFSVEGFVSPEFHKMTDAGLTQLKKRGSSKIVDIEKRKRFFAFSRTAFGIVKVRTNGKRLLIFTNCGIDDKKEVYAFTAARVGKLIPVEVVTA